MKLEKPLNSISSFSDSFSEEHPYPILRLDSAGRLIYANPASLPVLLEWNLEIGEIVGSEILSIAKAVETDGIAKKLELQHGRSTIELTFSPGIKKDFINIFGQDITIQKLAQQELQESKDIALNALAEAEEIQKSLEKAEIIGKFGSWEINLKDRSAQCSKGFLQVIGWSGSSAPSVEEFMKVVVESDRKILERALEAAVISRRPFSANYRVRLPDGVIRWLRGEGHPIYDERGDPIKVVGIGQDISEKLQNELELTEATIKAESEKQAKAAFLANMSHEIRTPMNGVLGMCHQLLTTVKDPAQIKQLQIIENCGNSMVNLINDILDFSKLEAGKIELETTPFNLVETVQEIVQLFAAQASEKKIQLSYSENSMGSSWVLGDPTRFRQVLTNLVSNAIKFTERGKISVSSKSFVLENGEFEIQFSVKDTGIGIPLDAVDKLFNSFAQADSSTARRFGGTGLGLAICKGLCEKMGGRIWVESKFGKGSSFYFTFRAKSCSAPASTEPKKIASPLLGKDHPLRILVAEDNRVNELVIRWMLEKLGYHADIAETGTEVLRKLQGARYDIVFMDCYMPGIDGFQAAKKIRASFPKEQCPRIVAITASASPEDRKRCRLAGMDEFLVKPTTIDELAKILKDCPPLKASDVKNAASRQAFAIHHPLRILVAEDNAVNQMVLMGLLEGLGYQPKLANNGLEVLELLRNQYFDLIVMDCHMPKMSGQEAAEKILAEVEKPPRIVGATADTSRENVEKCLKSGMEGVIFKPLTISKLTATLLDTRSKGTAQENLSPEILAAERFWRRFHGLEDVAESLISEFLACLPKLTLAIESAIRTENADALEIAAHTMKGVVANFYAQDCIQSAACLEKSGKDKNFQNAETLFRSLLAQLEALKGEIAKLTKQRRAA